VAGQPPEPKGAFLFKLFKSGQDAVVDEDAGRLRAVDAEDVDRLRRQAAQAAVDRSDDGGGGVPVRDVEFRADADLVAADLLEEAADLAFAVPVVVVVGRVDVIDAAVDQGLRRLGSGRGLPPSEISETWRSVRPRRR